MASLCFQLRGQVGEIERAFPLTPGRARVGSLPDSDIVLAVPGVSRAHALLTVSSEGLQLQDLGSKNGTFINGYRILTGTAGPSDEVAFGPVCLEVRSLDAEDARLGLVLDEEPSEDPSTALESAAIDPHSRRETEPLAHRGPRSRLRWLEEIDRFQERLEAEGSLASLSPALAELCRRLELPGLLVLEASPGEGSFTVLGSAGQASPSGLTKAQERRLRGNVQRPPAGSDGWLWERWDEGWSWGVLQRGSRQILLLGAEDRADERTLEAPGCRLLLRSIARCAGDGSSATSSPRDPEASSSRSVSVPFDLTFPDGYLEGESSQMRAVHQELARVAPTELPVLLIGETGVGKELLARTVHLSSARRQGPFVALNCAAIPDELLEAELFGVAPGAATNVQPRAGLFQRAEGGTVLLDEVGEMPLSLQPKILRALQEREIQPVGGPPMPIDVRVVSATNADLGQRSREGCFRSDLYFRLAGAEVQIPPLRKRTGDLPALIQRFVADAVRELGRPVRGVTARALDELARDPWRGNVRQLQHVLRRAVLRCPEGGAVDSEALRGLLDPAPDETAEVAGVFDLRSRIQRTEARAIREALDATGGHRTRAARLLGISRTTLHTKIELYGLAADPGELEESG